MPCDSNDSFSNTKCYHVNSIDDRKVIEQGFNNGCMKGDTQDSVDNDKLNLIENYD